MGYGPINPILQYFPYMGILIPDIVCIKLYEYTLDYLIIVRLPSNIHINMI